MSTAKAKREAKTSIHESDENACAVCFKHVDIYSIGACDHKICYECSTRMRVLCKQMECPICRQELVKVAFVKEVRPYQQLTFDKYLMDRVTRIYFESPAVKEAFAKLLAHSCRICSSNAEFPSFQLLKDHLRKDHEMFFCDLCVDNLKIFTWERKAYTRSELATHRRKGDADNTSHRGHPLCNFCDQRYLDDDELFRHLRRDHYFCHFCDADGLNQYYCTYEDLREHFREAHFLCEEGECKEEKFTRVFRTDIDFRAHRAQMHSQSLGKAAAKQARTLEVEFTLAPRAMNENKGRNQRRAGPRNREKEEPGPSNAPEQPTPRFAGAAATVAADIQNPQEFPSLTSNQQGSSTMQSRPSTTDSLAQKLTKGGRFNIRNGYAHDEEFPSLVADSAQSDLPKPEANKANKAGAGGTQRSVHVRLTNQEEPGKGALRNERSSNVSIQVTQKHPPSVTQGVGPPLPRVTRVSSSQNIRVQPSRDLQLDSEFPSLVPAKATAPAAQSTSKPAPGWVKNESSKTKNAPSKAPVAKGQNKKISEEYPSLVPSSSKSPFESSVSGLPKGKTQPVVNGSVNKTTAVPATKGPSSIASSVSESASSDASKARGKKKKGPNKVVGGGDDEEGGFNFATEAERKISEMQIGELKSLSTRMGRNILDLTGTANATEVKPSVGSKVGLIHQSQDMKPTESGGVKPKVKTKPPSLNQSEFPALSGNAGATTGPSVFERNHPVSASPVYGIENVTPTKVTFTSSSGQSFPLQFDNAAPAARTFIQPPDFSVRNQQLISNVTDLLYNDKNNIEKFRSISAKFRNGQLEAKQYYKNCLEIMGEECFFALFPELLCLLPDIEKQQQLLKVHRAEMKMIKGKVPDTEPYVVCATCSQVLYASSDLKHHIASHSLEAHFPALAPPPEAPSAWGKR